ncbi:hypothetical protein Taro_001934 [Colocasia esculenta]|uniref:H(+)/Pi cotransporter n=1 Tax=Colocasia esculenta TaxID=4460 RepID=A0A843TKA6_COLES|nr:hypothetical protein [Colocasia esculenta]
MWTSFPPCLDRHQLDEPVHLHIEEDDGIKACLRREVFLGGREEGDASLDILGGSRDRVRGPKGSTTVQVQDPARTSPVPSPSALPGRTEESSCSKSMAGTNTATSTEDPDPSPIGRLRPTKPCLFLPPTPYLLDSRRLQINGPYSHLQQDLGGFGGDGFLPSGGPGQHPWPWLLRNPQPPQAPCLLKEDPAKRKPLTCAAGRALAEAPWSSNMALKVLSALDSAKTQYYHFKAIVIAGMGLFTDAYDLFCIPPVMKMIGRLYYYDGSSENPGVIPPAVFTATVAIALVGTVIGQIVFGRLGDKIGRRRVYGISLLLMVSSSVGCGFSVCRTRACVLTSLCFFRFLLGIGIGGDYPLSATIMSEFSNRRTRGSFIAAVFSMQGFGILVSSAVTMAITAAFDHATDKTKDRPTAPPPEADLVWRLILMFGAIPAGLTFYWRMMMPETARYTALVEQDVRKAATDMETVLEGMDLQPSPEEAPIVPRPPPTYGLFSRRFLREHGRDLFACAGAWFILDIVFYSSNLFQSQIYKSWYPNPDQVNTYREAYNVAKFQAIIAVASTIPGYWATVCFIERVGRRKIQIMGFLLMGVFLFAIGGPYDRYWENKTKAWFIVLYALTFFFSNFGPNTTTFIVPAELFPARFRSTCHGISGAVGKVGAIIGSVGFLWASQSSNENKVEHGYHRGIGMMNSLLMLAVVCVVGAVFSYVYTPETMGRSLEDNERDAAEERRDGAAELGSNLSDASPRSTAPLHIVPSPSDGALVGFRP